MKTTTKKFHELGKNDSFYLLDDDKTLYEKISATKARTLLYCEKPIYVNPNTIVLTETERK